MYFSDLRHPDIKLQQKLEYLYGLRTGSKINWDNVAYIALLEALGNPHLHIPPVIHVAGTNGKGSVVAMLRAVLEAGGYKVHAYTSPHLLRANERIVLAGRDISDDAFESYIDMVLPLIGDAQLSFFEIMTAIAFKAFAETAADFALLEVGMGGRLDCTNVVPAPLVCAINRISLDHTEFLGETIEEIAAQKAGIIKKNVPCVLGWQGDEARQSVIKEVISAKAISLDAPLYVYGVDWRVGAQDNAYAFKMDACEITFKAPALLGAHQIYNAAMVLAVLNMMRSKVDISSEHIDAGFANVRWPGRLQQLKTAEFDCELWLDCGHNDSAGEILAAQASAWHLQDQKPLFLVLGMLGHKDLEKFVAPVLPFCAQVYCVGISGEPASQSAESAAQMIRKIAPQTKICIRENVQQAIEAIEQEQENPKRILIAGSVYLAGEVLAHR